MNDLMAALSTIFFDLDLTLHCTYAWYHSTVSGDPRGRTLSRDGRLHLEINTASEKTWNGILEVLLHEMCHVYMRVYICNKQCAVNVPSSCIGYDQVGQTGHGAAWQQIALWVETLSKTQLQLPHSLDLGRILGAIDESNVRGLPLPRWFVQRFFQAPREAARYYGAVASLLNRLQPTQRVSRVDAMKDDRPRG